MKNIIAEREIKKVYDGLFDHDPLTANVFLLLYELADENGEVHTTAEKEILHMMRVRFDDPTGYQL